MAHPLSRPPPLPATLGVVLGLLVAAPSAAGEVYRWVDDEGRVHYGDRPRGDAERVVLPASPTPDPHGAGRRQRRERLLRAWDEERAQRTAARKREAAERRRRERNCALARKQLDDYRHASYLYDEDADGNRRILDDDEHRHALAEASQAVARWCGP